MEGLFAQLLTTAFLATFIRSVVPLLLTALGGLFSERSGVVNIALDGLIIFGALAGAVSAKILEPSLGALAPWFGWLAGMIVGGLIAWIHAVLSIKYRADQVISGTAINLLASGVPAVILTALYQTSTESPKLNQGLPLWGVGELRFSPPVYFAFLVVALTWYVLYRTPYGLRLRATGEQPGAAASMGINVRRMRYSAVILSGVLAGTAGVFLSIGNLDSYVRNISAGSGFIALAALIQHALCYASPSRTEGFGLPPLEAMLQGCPAVVSTAGALPEVCGAAALYAAPDDPGAWVSAIRALADDPALRARHTALGRAHAAGFTWRRAGERLMDVLRDVALERRAAARR